MLLSIIIPVYNVELYIEKCLLSCVEQDVSSSEYEIIVINDGTKDKSAVIAKQIATRYDNIHIYDQNNQGLSAARNAGLGFAKGDYIWFVDSDDYLEKNCLSGVVSRLDQVIDILQIQYKKVYEDGTPDSSVSKDHIAGIKSGVEVTQSGGLPAPAQFSIYRRQFLIDNGLLFTRGIVHEDSEFKPKAVYLANQIASYDGCCYNYLQRCNGSIMSSYSLKRLMDIIYVNDSLIDFCQELPNDIKRAIYNHIGLNINSLLDVYKRLSVNEKFEIKRLLRENNRMFIFMTKAGKLKYKIEGAVFLSSLSLGLWLHHMLS